MGVVFNNFGDPGKVFRVLQRKLDEHGDGNRQQHAARAPHPPPEDNGEDDHGGGYAELAPQEKRLNAIADGAVDDEIAGGDHECAAPAVHGERHDDAGHGRHNGADGGNVVQHEGDDAPQERERHVHPHAHAPHQQPRGHAGNRLDKQVFLDTLQRAQEIILALVTVRQGAQVAQEQGASPRKKVMTMSTSVQVLSRDTICPVMVWVMESTLFTSNKSCGEATMARALSSSPTVPSQAMVSLYSSLKRTENSPATWPSYPWPETG